MEYLNRSLTTGIIMIMALMTPFCQVLAQPLIKQGNPYAVSPFKDVNGNLINEFGKVGIGLTSPIARLHLRSTAGMSTQPMQEMDLFSGLNPIGSIQHFVSIGGQNYGIYQSSVAEIGLLNYFKDPVKIGNFTISKEGTNITKMATDQGVIYINYVMNSNYGPQTTPLSVSGYGIRVRSRIITDEFQMINGAGANKILMSDDAGNARWSDLAGNTVSPWIVTGNKDIVSNRECHFVGIGTDRPTQLLEVCPTEPAGGISINQLSEEDLGSEIVFKKNSEPQCAIGHTFASHRPSYFLWSHLADRNLYYVDLRNGMTGIGTVWPATLLDVAGDLRVQTRLGVGCIPPADPNGLYKLYVEGGIKARDIKVTNTVFPDYCFEDDYPLMSLNDLRAFIKEN